MGWYLRKGLNFGPLRLNLSKSGLGYSLGVKGARFGVSPRGTYVHFGRGGVYYRQFLSGSPRSTPPQPSQPLLPAAQQEPQGTVIPTADVGALRDSSADELLQELQEKHSLARYAWVVSAIAGGFILLLLLLASPGWLILTSAVFASVTHLLLSKYDRQRKTVDLFYTLDSATNTAYSAVRQAFGALASCRRLWRVITEDRVLDQKYQAGATSIINRKTASMSRAAPPFVRTNLELWRLDVSGQTLYFLPDRLLVYQGGSIGAVAYDSLDGSAAPTRFIETEGVPSDSQVVGQTWRYVNKGGGPDRRFSSNPQIPVVLYGQIQMHSQTGMNLILQASSVENARLFAEGVQAYAQHCSQTHKAVEKKERPSDEAPTPEFAPPPYSPFLAKWGWTPAPLLLVSLALATLVMAAQRSPAPVNAIPATVAPAPTPSGPPPKFQVFRNQRGRPVVVVVSSKTTDDELKNLLFFFRDKVKRGKLPGIGIPIPTHQAKGRAASDFSTGSIFVYRGKKYANESADKTHSTSHADATYTWAPSGEWALVRTAAGLTARAF